MIGHPRRFVSVIVPTYHRNDLLRKCLSCLAPSNQLYPSESYEVIVSDDGSKTTAQQMMAREFPWAKWVAGPRRGPAANRNHGVSQARGEWLAFTDDDCLPKPEWLSAFFAAIEANISVYEGKTTCEIGLHSPLEISPINETGGYLWSCNMMVNKLIYDQMGGFDENFPRPHMEDVDFRERLKAANQNILFVPEAVIDHPPREVPWGIRSGASVESEMLFWYKQGNRNRYAPLLLYRTAKNRWRYIRNFPASLDSLSALISLIIEVAWVFKNIFRWENKYRDKYLNSG